MDNTADGNFFKEIIGHINEYVYSATLRENRIISFYHSPKSLLMTGYTPEELCDDLSLWQRIIYPDDFSMVSGFLMYARQRSSSSTIEHRIVHKNGSVRWVTNSCSIIVDKQNNLERLDGVVADITERKKRVLELTRLTRVVEQSPSAVVVTGITGDIEYVNPKCCEITGYSFDGWTEPPCF
jgi:sigma-B regulation protein RsbU (phosphoserine phosphatase)